MTLGQRIVKFLCTLNSISPYIMVYLLKCDHSDKNNLWINDFHYKTFTISGTILSAAIYILIILSLSALLLLLFNFFPNTEINSINSIGFAHDSFLPSYLGFFFISLSIPDENYTLLLIILLILILFLYKTDSFFYNPIFILFGYKFYHVTLSEGKNVLVITKKNDKEEILNKENMKLHRINDYSFIDLGKKV